MAKNVLLRDQAYQLIMEKIISSDYKMGTYLDEKTISNEIGINRTPVREALIKIEHIGLVEIMPQKGIFVCQIGYKDVYDHYSVRLFMEPHLITMWGEKLSPEKLNNFRQAFVVYQHQTSEMDLYELDNAFHRYILSLSDNKYLESVVTALEIDFIRMRIISHVNQKSSISVCLKHIDIIDALLNKDYKSARLLLEKHILESREENIAAFIKALK